VDAVLAPDFDNLAAVLPTCWLSGKIPPRLLARSRPSGVRTMDCRPLRAIRTKDEATIWELQRQPRASASSCCALARPGNVLRLNLSAHNYKYRGVGEVEHLCPRLSCIRSASCPTHSYRELLGFGSDLIPGFANETANWIGLKSFRDGWLLGKCSR